MSDQPRPVWLTEGQRGWLAHAVKQLRSAGCISSATFVGEVVAAWDAAPADALEAATTAAVAIHPHSATAVRYALRALGMPDAFSNDPEWRAVADQAAEEGRNPPRAS